MNSDAANRLAGVVSIIVPQTRALVAGRNAAVRMRAALFAAILVTLALALSTTARAATITVDSLADTGAPGICVLRDAITAANTMTVTNGCTAGDGNDTIQFSVRGTIALSSTLPQVTDTQLTINGSASPGITVDGGGQVQVMSVASGTELNLNNLTITNGFNHPFGGAIANFGTLTVTKSTFSGNRAPLDGGVIDNEGTLAVTKSTFSGNRAGNAGGIFNLGTLSVTNSTFSGNRAASRGGGIFNLEGTLTVTNSTFSGNIAALGGSIVNTLGAARIKSTILAASGSGGNCAYTSLRDAGYNISDDSSCGFSATGSLNNTDPMLAPAGLRHNGGPTKTIALLSGSPAIDAIPLADCTNQASLPHQLHHDQRGFPRPDNGESACDIGAYEFQDAP